MIHQLENNNFSVKINGIGAELCSFIAKKTGVEYVWQGNPTYWGSTAPVLFPIIGALKDGVFIHNAQEFAVPKHGFIRHNENLQIHRKLDHEITFSLASSEELKKSYPFDFQFNITFTLKDNVLEVSHKVVNTGKDDLWFSLGGHPAFNCPLLPNEKYDDYYLDFNQEVSLSTTVLSAKGLLTDEHFEVISKGRELGLSEELFANDALIFKDIESKKVSLKSKNHSHGLAVSFTDFKNLGVWAKYRAPFVCIEPWLGVTDHQNTNGVFMEKEGIIGLPKGEKFMAKFEI